MKATKSLPIAVIAMSVLASNVFALITSPDPGSTSPSDTIHRHHR
jgi:hypothetical protein